MPAWHGAGASPHFTGIKIVSVVPGNARRGKATVIGSYLLLDGTTGEPVAVMDGRELTLWRTAAASALAASYLARPDASRLLMVGAGALAPFLIRAHASQRPIREVAIWNRDPAKAEALAGSLGGGSLRVSAVSDLDAALGEAHIVSAATLSAEPLVHGARLSPGAHVDLVGGFTPDMREADDEAIRRATLFADTRAGACHEAGDLVQPMRAGLITEADVRADLFELCRGLHPGRSSDGEITLFKSVGTALEDLAAAALVHARSA
jgi:alanine dehydrogenase